MGTGPALDLALSSIGSTAEVIRSWFFQRLATTNGLRDWTAFDHTLAVARAHGVKVVATLGNQWGSCEGVGDRFDSWYGSGYRSATDPGSVSPYRQWVAEVVNRYRNESTIAMWQLMNEAEVKTSSGSCGSATTLRAFAADVAGLIKSIDSNHLVSLGTMGGGQCGTQGSDYQSVHSLSMIDVCEYHDYGSTAAMPGDQWNGLQVRINQCNGLGKPIFVGEMGMKPSDIGGTFQARADIIDQKMSAQFSAGVRGVLAWAWSNEGSQLTNFDIGVGDPALAVVRAY